MIKQWWKYMDCKPIDNNPVSLVRAMKNIYEEKDKKELIRLLLLKNEQILKAEEEIERLNKLVKFIQDKLRKAVNGEVTTDPIVNRIIKRHIARHKEGMQKFGKTMADNKRPTKEWVKDAQEEAIDLILYLEKIL